MGQPGGMRVTVDAAMRARDVSRPRPDGQEPPPPTRPAASPSASASESEPGRRGGKAAKNERRRLDKRGARTVS